MKPCELDPTHCWAHHEGSVDCVEHDPRGCQKAREASREDKRIRDEIRSDSVPSFKAGREGQKEAWRR